MKIYMLRWKEFRMPDGEFQNCVWVGTEAENCKQYLVPVRMPEANEVIGDEWTIRPSSTGRPLLQANAGKSLGMILRLSALDGPGKAFGRLYAASGDPRLVTSGVACLGDLKFEEAVFVATDPSTSFILCCTSGRERMVYTDLEEVWEALLYNPETPKVPLSHIRRWNEKEN